MQRLLPKTDRHNSVGRRGSRTMLLATKNMLRRCHERLIASTCLASDNECGPNRCMPHTVPDVAAKCHTGPCAALRPPSYQALQRRFESPHTCDPFVAASQMFSQKFASQTRSPGIMYMIANLQQICTQLHFLRASQMIIASSCTGPKHCTVSLRKRLLHPYT